MCQTHFFVYTKDLYSFISIYKVLCCKSKNNVNRYICIYNTLYCKYKIVSKMFVYTNLILVNTRCLFVNVFITLKNIMAYFKYLSARLGNEQLLLE